MLCFFEEKTGNHEDVIFDLFLFCFEESYFFQDEAQANLHLEGTEGQARPLEDREVLAEQIDGGGITFGQEINHWQQPLPVGPCFLHEGRHLCFVMCMDFLE